MEIRQLHHFAKEGAFAVSFFFCLAGYILAHVYYRKEAAISKKEFYIKRFARIYPLHFLGFALALALGIVLLHAIPKGNSIILQAFGLQAWVPAICLEINYPAWSLSMELFFYLCFPFLLQWFKKLSTVQLTGVTLFIWVVSAALHVLTKSADHGNNVNWGNFMLYNISYAMYILQHPVREAYEALLKPASGAPATVPFYFFLIALILTSAFAFLYIEKPLRQIIINRYYKKS